MYIYELNSERTKFKVYNEELELVAESANGDMGLIEVFDEDFTREMRSITKRLRTRITVTEGSWMNEKYGADIQLPYKKAMLFYAAMCARFVKFEDI